MKKVIFILIVLSLFISGCSGIPTGKGVLDPEVDERIIECMELCGEKDSEEEFYKSCSQIYKYGGEELFNEYMETCKKDN